MHQQQDNGLKTVASEKLAFYDSENNFTKLYSFIIPSIQSFEHSFVRFITTLIHSFIQSLILTFIHQKHLSIHRIHSIHSLIHSFKTFTEFIHSFIHSLIHSFTEFTELTKEINSRNSFISRNSFSELTIHSQHFTAFIYSLHSFFRSYHSSIQSTPRYNGSNIGGQFSSEMKRHAYVKEETRRSTNEPIWKCCI